MKKDKGNGNGAVLIGGCFRKGSNAAELFSALKSKPRSWKELKKLGGKNVKARIYRMARVGKTSKRFVMHIASDKVKMVAKKSAA